MDTNRKFSPSSKGLGHAGNMSIETGGTACEIKGRIGDVRLSTY